MGKDEVEPPEMKLEGRAEELLRHRRALDVPAGAASAPGRVPGRVLSRLCGLPECEVARVLLERARILVGLELVEPLSREVSVVVEPGDAKVDIAAGLVREAVPDELLDQRDDLRDRLGGLRLVVRAAETKPIGVLHIPLRRAGGELSALSRRGVVDLVVDV